MGPWLIFGIALAKVIVWPAAVVLVIYLRGEALLGLFRQHSITVRHGEDFTLEILPRISELLKTTNWWMSERDDEENLRSINAEAVAATTASRSSPNSERTLNRHLEPSFDLGVSQVLP